jgi:hypothetical protein
MAAVTFMSTSSMTFPMHWLSITTMAMLMCGLCLGQYGYRHRA